MRKRHEGQLALGWQRPSRELPADVVEAARKLLAQLLRGVMDAERDGEGDDNE